MGRKDHLPTSDEVSRKTQRDTRRAIQTVYIGSPPTITRNLQEVGAQIKTENEVRDTDFPILADIEDLTDNIQTIVTATTKTIQVELGKQEAQFHRLFLDDDAGIITDFFVNFVGLAKNKALEFIVDIETLFGGTPNITFNPPLIGLPTAFGAIGNDEFKLQISAIDTPIITVYEVLNGADSGGSLSEPIELGFNEVITQALPTLTVISGNMFNPSHVNLDQDIELQLDISANPSKYKSIFVIFDTTGGGFSVTWPASVVNPPIIDDSIATRISVILYTLDNGALWTHATSVGSSFGTGSDEFFGPWTANHDAGVNSLVNAAAVAYVDTLGFPRGTIAGDNGAAALRLSLDSGGKFLISDVLTDIVSFDDATGIKLEGTHVFNANNNIINQISELQLSNLNAHTPLNELSIAFDTNDDALKYSVPLTTDVHMFFADTDLLATFSRVGTNEGLLSIQAVTAAFLQATETLFLSTFNNVTPTNGEIWRDSGDGKFKFQQNGVTDELGIPSSIVDGNSSAIILDAAPAFAVVLNGVQKYSISNTRVDYEELDLFGITQINMNDDAANLISSLTSSASGLLLNIFDTTDVYDIKFNGADAFHIDELRTRILSTTPNTTDPELSLFRDDPSPTTGDIGSILFEGRNSVAEQISYGVIAVGATNVTDTTESAVLVANLFDNGLSVQQLRLEDGTLRIRKFSSVASDVAALNLEKEDTSPISNDSIAEINFNINDLGVVTTYASISATIIDATDNAALGFSVRADNGLISAMVIQGDDNNQRFQMLMSGTSQFRIQPVFDRMGYFVTPQVLDFSLILGVNGSLQIPQFSDGLPSLNDLNQAGGAFDGAIVHDTFDGDLYIRANSGRWDRYARTGTVP